MPRPRPEIDAPGQDSFLDIVANLVGILIILVLVIGVQAKDAMISAAAPLEAEPDELTLQVERARAAAYSVESNINEIEAKSRQQDFEIKYRREERNLIQLQVAKLEAELNERREKMDQAAGTQFDARQNMLAAQSELEALKKTRAALDHQIDTPGIIEHLPTPMAKTVFGEEVHMRLQGGRVAVLPWDELVNRLKREAPQKLWKLKDSGELTESIGPVRGFRMEYTLRRANYALQTRAGTALQQRIELDHFKLHPMADNLGQPVAMALREGSELDSELDSRDPKNATVTVWVYPDSYAEFRTIKKYMFGRGFLTAGRPLPAGELIGGAPNGTRSAAQ